MAAEGRAVSRSKGEIPGDKFGAWRGKGLSKGYWANLGSSLALVMDMLARGQIFARGILQKYS